MQDQAVDPGLMATQKLDPAAMRLDVAANEEDEDVIDSITESGAMEIDQSFINELDQTMNDEISQDQVKS